MGWSNEARAARLLTILVYVLNFTGCVAVWPDEAFSVFLCGITDSSVLLAVHYAVVILGLAALILGFVAMVTGPKVAWAYIAALVFYLCSLVTYFLIRDHYGYTCGGL